MAFPPLSRHPRFPWLRWPLLQVLVTSLSDGECLLSLPNCGQAPQPRERTRTKQRPSPSATNPE
eukprot:4975022-Pleurochrysis_carterae.AAC.2